jgi:hypothetical protein
MGCLRYLGRCDVPCYREGNVEELRSRVGQIRRDRGASAGCGHRRKPLFWCDHQKPPSLSLLIPI